jgi:hypothetical protein
VEIERLSAALDEGVDNGVLPDEIDTQGLQVRAVRNWLCLLGYLARDNQKTVVDDDLLEGLGRFCEECGVATAPSGLGPAIVASLRALVCFDTETASAGRFAGLALDGTPIARAVGLRLYALDLLDRPPGAKPDRPELLEGLRRFSRVQELLGLGTPAPDFVLPTLDALFTNEPVLERLRTSHVFSNALDAAERRKERQWVKRYVDAVASIELWLIGYLTRPRRHMLATDDSNRSLPAALRAFWRDQPEEARPPKASLDDVDSLFFNRLEAVTHEDGSDEDDDETLRARIDQDPELAGEVRRQTMGLGARILDGVRRVVRFIGGWLRKRLGGLIALARNIAAVLADRARNVFAAVRKLATAFKLAWSFLARKPVASSDPANLLVSHDRDFDFVLVARTGASPARLAQISGQVLGLATLFGNAARFVGELVGAFLAVARRTGLGGWFGAVLALLDLRGRIAEMIDLVRAMRQQLDALG